MSRDRREFACQLCGKPVWLDTKGRVVEHLKPRIGPLPEGCKASGHRPSVVTRMAEKEKTNA